MAKKAKHNVTCGIEFYEAGRVYDDAQVAHLDQADFEDVAEAPVEPEVAPEAPTEKPKRARRSAK